MTRVTTATRYELGVQSLQQRQRELLEIQEQLTTGKRVNRASDDPAAAARAERAMAAVSRADADKRGLDSSRNAMTQAESSLGDASELMQQARELLVASGSTTWGASERADAAAQLRALRGQLLSVANRGDGAGGYIFGGQGGGGAPFIDTTLGVSSVASGGVQHTASDEPVPLTLDGRTAWLAAPRGNGVFETQAVTNAGAAWIDPGRVTDPSALTGDSYAIAFSVAGGNTTYSITRNGAPTGVTNAAYEAGRTIQMDGMAFTISGQPADADVFAIEPSTSDLSVFETLDQTIAALDNPNANLGQTLQAVKSGLRDLDSVIDNTGAWRSQAGAWLNRLDSSERRLGETKLAAQTRQSAAVDVDMAQAVSEFQMRQTGYDAALRSYSMVQQLSLFNYLKG